MCIIVVQPRAVSIEPERIETMWNRNRDGAGYAYVDDSGIINIKRFMEQVEFEKAWYKDQENYNFYSPFLLHFRIKTHGKVSVGNNHPFLVHQDLCFAHNGTIKLPIPERYTKRQWSDTRYFNYAILKNLDPNFFRNVALKTLIEDYIGHSKLAFLNSDGEFTIFNESKGVWDEHVWYSNSGYKPYTTATTSYGYGSYDNKTTTTDVRNVQVGAGNAPSGHLPGRDPASAMATSGTNTLPASVAPNGTVGTPTGTAASASTALTVVREGTKEILIAGGTPEVITPELKKEIVQLANYKPHQQVTHAARIKFSAKELLAAAELMSFVKWNEEEVYEVLINDYTTMQGITEECVWGSPESIIDMCAFYEAMYADMEPRDDDAG